MADCSRRRVILLAYAMLCCITWMTESVCSPQTNVRRDTVHMREVGHGAHGDSANTSTKKAWLALLSECSAMKTMCEEGVFFIDPKTGHPRIFLVGAKYVDLWRRGIEGYGVRYRAGKLEGDEQVGRADFLKGLRQIGEGERAGAFRDRKGDIVVPGLQFFPTNWDRSEAVRLVKDVQDRMTANLQEAMEGYRQLEAFFAQHSMGYVPIAAADHDDWAVRKKAVEDLVGMQALGKDVVPALLAKLEDAHPRVREAAAIALGKFSNARVQAALAKAAQDHNPRVRLLAVLALSQHGSSQLAQLKRLMKDDPSANVRAAASYAIKQLRELPTHRRSQRTR